MCFYVHSPSARASGDRAVNSSINFISSFAKQTNPMRGMNLIDYILVDDLYEYGQSLLTVVRCLLT